MTGAICGPITNPKPQPLLQNYGVSHLFKPVYKYMASYPNLIQISSPHHAFVKNDLVWTRMTVLHYWGHKGAYHQPQTQPMSQILKNVQFNS